jgi:hypothetical protein
MIILRKLSKILILMKNRVRLIKIMITKLKARNHLKEKIIQNKRNMNEIKKLKCLKKQIKTKVVKNAAKGNRINHQSVQNLLMENHWKEKVSKIMIEILILIYF